MKKGSQIIKKIRLSTKTRDGDRIPKYILRLKLMGEVDFIRAFRQTSTEMLERAERKEIFDRR